MRLNRVILTTGGTFGHIFPALAVARELQQRNPNIQILFIGGPGPEGEMACKNGLEFKELPASGIMGRGVEGILSGLGWLGTGIPKALAEVWRFEPDAVLGFGGYAGFCPVLAARMLGKPSAIHEQNSVPGMANRVLGKVVNRVFLSFPDLKEAFPATKTFVTGNPVRPEFFEAADRRRGRAEGRRVLVVGGSQGAKPINDAFLAALPALMEAGVTLVHQAGAADYTRVRDAYVAAGADPAEYAPCDLAVCRSGASTVFEIAAMGVPAIFVPFPQATHDHQTMNAKAMTEIGAARLLPQASLTGRVLAEAVTGLLADRARLKHMEDKARELAKRHAAADIVAGLEALTA